MAKVAKQEVLKRRARRAAQKAQKKGKAPLNSSSAKKLRISTAPMWQRIVVGAIGIASAGLGFKLIIAPDVEAFGIAISLFLILLGAYLIYLGIMGNKKTLEQILDGGSAGISPFDFLDGC